MIHFAWKSKKESNFKNRGQQRTAIIKHICRAADSKWLLTQTMSLLLHQTKLVFKGNLSYISEGVCQLFHWHHHLQYFVCIFLSPSASQCIFSLLNFTPRNIFTPTYRCNWHRHSYKTLFFPPLYAEHLIDILALLFPWKKLFGNSYSSQLTH